MHFMQGHHKLADLLLLVNWGHWFSFSQPSPFPTQRKFATESPHCQHFSLSKNLLWRLLDTRYLYRYDLSLFSIFPSFPKPRISLLISVALTIPTTAPILYYSFLYKRILRIQKHRLLAVPYSKYSQDPPRNSLLVPRLSGNLLLLGPPTRQWPQTPASMQKFNKNHPKKDFILLVLYHNIVSIWILFFIPIMF